MLEHIHHIAYTVDDIEKAIIVFRDVFELEFVERRTTEGPRSFEMATFRVGPSFIELMQPINYPDLEKFLKDNGPGLNHVAFAVKNLDENIEKLREKGIYIKEPGAFIAGTGWKIANFDFEKCDLPYFESKYHDDHLAAIDDDE